MTYLMYSREGHVSGARLANFLGIEHGEDGPGDERADYLIRYGSRRRVRYVPNHDTINLRRNLDAASTKQDQLNILHDAHLPCPPWWTSIMDCTAEDFPILGRSDGGHSGRGIHLYVSPMHYIHEGSPDHDFFTSFIPKIHEYRIHVIGGKVVKVSQKMPTGPHADPDNPIWNYGNGWTFRQPDSAFPFLASMGVGAVTAMGLDFGAVDLIVSEEEDPYILEVNTAPGLSDPTLETYAHHLAPMVGLDPDEIPGWDNVERQDEEDE